MPFVIGYHLVANIIMLHKVVDLTKVINEMVDEGYEVKPEFVRPLIPDITEHIKRFGQYILDVKRMPGPLDLSKLSVAWAFREM